MIGEINALKGRLYELENQAGVARDFSAAFLDSVEDILFYKTPDHIYIGCNAAFASFTGKPKEFIIGKTDTELFNRKDAKTYRESDLIVLKSGKHVSSEWVINTDGQQIFLETHKALLKNHKNEPIGIIGISRDKTEHENTLKALRESELKYRNLIELAADAIVVFDSHEKFVEVNVS